VTHGFTAAPEFSVCYLDVSQNLRDGQMPFYLLERPLPHDQPKAWSGQTEIARVGKFWIPLQSLLVADQQWFFVDKGEKVLVPIHAYRTASRSLTTIFGLGQQLAILAMTSFRAQVQESLVRVVQILGHDCTDLAGEGVDAFRCYCGFAFEVESK